MSSGEILVPFTADDFNPGDTVFRANYGHTFDFGVINEIDEDILGITLDDGERQWVPLKEFQNLNSDEGMVYKITKGVAWGKLMDISQIEVGSRISRFEFYDKIRIYGYVSEFRLPEGDRQGYLTLVWDVNGSEKRAYELPSIFYLKKAMVHYDLEP